MTDCLCCDPPIGFNQGVASYCTLHKLLATDDEGWTVDSTWSQHHCQDAASPKVALGAPQVIRVRTDGTDVYTLGRGCGLRTVLYNTPGADNFTWPVGVRKITVTVTPGGGSGGSSSSATGGGGGGAWARKVFTRDYDDNSPRIDNLFVGAAGEDSWYFNSSTVLAKAGTDGSGTTGGAGGAAASSIGDTVQSGGDGADADGTTGGGGGGSGNGQTFGASADGSTAVGVTGGSSLYSTGDGGDGGTDGNSGSDGISPGGGGGGSGDNDSTPGAGAAGSIVVSYHVYQPLQKWDSDGDLQWEIETRISDTAGLVPTALAVHDGLVVAIANGMGASDNSYVIAAATSTGAISWVYEAEERINDIAMADSGVYAIGFSHIQRWDTAGNLLNRLYLAAAAIEGSGIGLSGGAAGGQSIAVDADCNVYASFVSRVLFLDRPPPTTTGDITGRTFALFAGQVVKFAPLETVAGALNDTAADPPGMLATAELGPLDCVDDELSPLELSIFPMPLLSLSPDETTLYVGVRTIDRTLCALHKMDTATMGITWGRQPPGSVLDEAGDPYDPYDPYESETLAPYYDITDLSARDDGVLGVAQARDTLGGFAQPDVDAEKIQLAFSYDDAGNLEYQAAMESPGGLSSFPPESYTPGHLLTVAAETDGVWYAGGSPAECAEVIDPDESEGDTCCDEEATVVNHPCLGVIPGCNVTDDIPAEVADVVPPFACWDLPAGLSQECLDCLEGIAGNAITWRLVQRERGKHTWKASIRLQCYDAAGDCGDEHWVDLTAQLQFDDWTVWADFKCGDGPLDPYDPYDDGALFWGEIHAQYVVSHCGSDVHEHPWFVVCCLACEEEDPPSNGLCAWQWSAALGDWVLLQSFAEPGYTCDGAEPEADGTTDCEISCTCPCGVGCTEADEDYVWSKSCPCELIPKQFVGTMAGLGCFAGDTIEITYNWQGDCVWEGVFTPDASCPSETATHTLVETDDGWDGTMSWTCATGVKTAHHPMDCETLTIGPGDTDYFWTAEELTCECCGEGGFGDPGVDVPCCEDPVASALTATIVNTTGDCTGLEGAQFPVTNYSEDGWRVDTVLAGKTVRFDIVCDGPLQKWRFSTPMVSDCVPTVSNPLETATCDPFSLTYTGGSFTGSGCCSGSFDIEITG